MERRVRAADPRDLQEGGRKTRQVDARFILDHEMGGRIQSLAFILLHTFFFFIRSLLQIGLSMIL